MTAFLPLSNTLQLGFHFPNTNQPLDQNNLNNSTQSTPYPRVTISRGYAAESLCSSAGLIGSRRADSIDISWEEYCCLVQSKPLALNILTFRDYTNSQTDGGRMQYGLAIQNHTASQSLTSSFYNGNYRTSLNTASTGNNPNYTLPSGGHAVFHQTNPNYARYVGCPYARLSTSHPTFLPYMNQSSVWNNVPGSTQPRNWPSQETQRQYAEQQSERATSSHQHLGNANQPQNNLNTSITNFYDTRGQPTQSLDNSNVSTPNGGRSPTTSTVVPEVSSNSSLTLPSILDEQSDDPAHLPIQYQDEIMSEYENDEDEREINLSTTRLSPNSASPPERVYDTGQGERVHLLDQNT